MVYRSDNHLTRRLRRRRSSRRGASAVELAVVLVVFLTLVFGMLDLGLGVFRYHVLAQAARQGVRKAIVHGALADRLGPWGPATYSGTGADAHPLADAIRPSLTGLDPSEATIQAEWVDGDNALEEPVRVTVSAPFRPVITFIFGNPTWTLRGSSTMPIAH